jgi:hypothetical protein
MVNGDNIKLQFSLSLDVYVMSLMGDCVDGFYYYYVKEL